MRISAAAMAIGRSATTRLMTAKTYLRPRMWPYQARRRKCAPRLVVTIGRAALRSVWDHESQSVARMSGPVCSYNLL